MLSLLIALGLGFAAPHANAQVVSGSASGSCSNTLSGFGYFYAYTYQYAAVSGGRVSTETHTFTFSGFLDGMENAAFIGVNGRHLIYANRRIELAVPYISGAGLHMRALGIPDGPDGRSGWIKLCSY